MSYCSLYAFWASSAALAFELRKLVAILYSGTRQLSFVVVGKLLFFRIKTCKTSNEKLPVVLFGTRLM